MKKITYELTETVCKLCETPVISYGIVCKKKGKIEKKYPDIMPDKVKIQELVDECNKSDVDPKHLEDIIEDFIG